MGILRLTLHRAGPARPRATVFGVCAALVAGALSLTAAPAQAAGHAGRTDGGPSTSALLTSLNSPPGVTSTEFPNGDGGTWGAPARSVGHFTFDANGVPDVVTYEWYVDVASQAATVPAATPGASVTVSFTPPNAGPHHLHVTSIDAAGNRSEARNYLFYATGSGGRDDYGDLNGDHNTDLWAVDKATGRLQVHPGQGDGTFGPATDADAADFTGTSITHRGDWGEDGYEDLIVLKTRPDGQPGIFRRANNGLGALQSSDVGEEEFGTYEAANRTWGAGGQVVSLGTVNDDNADGLYDEDDYADLLVLSSGKLWLYYASKSPFLDELAAPVAIGGTDWADKTIMTPGDTTGDGLPELWVRENTTGLVYAYPSRTDANGNFDPAAYADTTTRIQIGTGFTAAAYPQLTSDGDLEKSAAGPPYPDLWGTDPQGNIVEFPGRALSAGSAFGPARALVPTGPATSP